MTKIWLTWKQHSSLTVFELFKDCLGFMLFTCWSFYIRFYAVKGSYGHTDQPYQICHFQMIERTTFYDPWTEKNRQSADSFFICCFYIIRYHWPNSRHGKSQVSFKLRATLSTILYNGVSQTFQQTVQISGQFNLRHTLSIIMYKRVSLTLQ